MKSTVLVFSATRALFETIISAEVKLLSKKHDVVILSEYPDIPLMREASYVSFYRPRYIKQKLPFIRSFFSIPYYKKIAHDLIDRHQPEVVILHQDSEFYTNFFVYTLSKQKRIKFILRRPSVVIAPQYDFRWQSLLGRKSLISYSLRSFLLKIYFDIFLSIIFTGKTSITRTAFWLNRDKMWVDRKKRIYDVSLCYSERCQNYLSTIYESSQVISNPLLLESCNQASFSKQDSVLFISSNDIEAVMDANRMPRNEAMNYVKNKINGVARVFVEHGMEFHIRFKGDGDISFIDPDLKPFARAVDNHVSLYEQVKEYKEIAGFVTTALWLLAINQAPQKIYSFQLLNTEFYNYFFNHKGVKFIKWSRGRYNIDIKNSELSNLRVVNSSNDNSIMEYL